MVMENLARVAYAKASSSSFGCRRELSLASIRSYVLAQAVVSQTESTPEVSIRTPEGFSHNWRNLDDFLFAAFCSYFGAVNIPPLFHIMFA